MIEQPTIRPLEPTPFRQMVSTYLRPVPTARNLRGVQVTVLLFDDARWFGAEAIAGCGVGLDHFRGERVLAGIMIRKASREVEHRLAGAITDRRTVFSGYSSVVGGYNLERHSILHADIERVELQEIKNEKYIDLHDSNGLHRLHFSEAAEMFLGFYQAFIQILPKEALEETSTPLVTLSKNDPIGLYGAVNSLWFQDEQTLDILRTIEAKFDGEHINEKVGIDLVNRAVLAHRSNYGGPGMDDHQAWISPMSAKDFVHCLSGMFASTIGSGADGVWQFLDFQIAPTRRQDGVEEMAAGLANVFTSGISVFGDSPQQRQPVSEIRVAYTNMDHYCAFHLMADLKPLCQVDSLLAFDFHQVFIESSLAVLRGRCELGWTVPYGALMIGN